MSYNISDAEKMQAEKALICFNQTEKLLKQAQDHLNIMKTPFKEDPSIKPEDIMTARAAIRRFRDKAVENFNQFKIAAFQCINAMQIFSTDTQTLKIMKSFIASVDELEDSVNKLIDLFDDLQDSDFVKNVVTNIEQVQNKCDDVEEIIDERVKPHIQTNILSVSWIDAVSKDYQMNIEKKTPLILELNNARQDQINDYLKNKE